MATVEKTIGEVVSRAVMAVVAVGLVFGGVKCLYAASLTSAAYYRQHPYTFHDSNRPAAGDSDSTLLLKIGWGLISGGLLFGLGSVAPLSLVPRFYSPPEL